MNMTDPEDHISASEENELTFQCEVDASDLEAFVRGTAQSIW